MTDEEIVNTVKHLESHIGSYEQKEYLGAATVAAMKLMCHACSVANVGELTITIKDYTHNENPNEKNDFEIIIRKITK